MASPPATATKRNSAPAISGVRRAIVQLDPVSRDPRRCARRRTGCRTYQPAGGVGKEVRVGRIGHAHVDDDGIAFDRHLLDVEAPGLCRARHARHEARQPGLGKRIRFGQRTALRPRRWRWSECRRRCTRRNRALSASSNGRRGVDRRHQQAETRSPRCRSRETLVPSSCRSAPGREPRPKRHSRSPRNRSGAGSLPRRDCASRCTSPAPARSRRPPRCRPSSSTPDSSSLSCDRSAATQSERAASAAVGRISPKRIAMRSAVDVMTPTTDTRTTNVRQACPTPGSDVPIQIRKALLASLDGKTRPT